MTMFFYYSLDKTSGWVGAPAEQRQQVIDRYQPKYVTVLNVSDLLGEDDVSSVTQAEWLDLKYQGPFYADWDCSDRMDGADSVRRFLKLLQDRYDVDPRVVAIYLSGKRGYHVEVPFACFSQTKFGIVKFLPYVYREMANSLYTDDLDMNVYSGKRGRMWRTPNVEREEKGLHKVPISYQQLKDMTEELYNELVATPQPAPALIEPTFSPSMNALFKSTQKKIEDALHRQKKQSEKNAIDVKRYGGEWPDAVLQLMSGENLADNVGLNKIALQLGIMSAAIGKSLDQHLEACKGLIESYRGDGHGTPSEVRRELIRMYKYAEGNPVYAFSPGGVIHLMSDKTRGDEISGRGAMKKVDDADDMADLTGGVMYGTNGLYSRTDSDARRETNWHYDSATVCHLKDPLTNETRGFVMQSRSGGRTLNTVTLDAAAFNSAETMKRFLAQQNAVGPRIDAVKAAGIGALIMNASRTQGDVMALAQEGINFVNKPDQAPEVVWSSPHGCLGHGLKFTYKLHSQTNGRDGVFKSDLASAPLITDMPELAPKVIEALLHFNANNATVAGLLGWLSACYHKPMLAHWGKQFPSLQCYGEAGSGKTQICLVLMPLFYYRATPCVLNAAGGSAFGRRAIYSGTSSIPVLVDEFKPEKMHPDQVREFRMLLHSSYTPGFQSPRGGGDARQVGGGSWNDVAMDTKSAPIFFTTERAETETAIQERTLALKFNKAGIEEHKRQFNTLSSNPEVLSALGAVMMKGVLKAPLDKLEKRFRAIRDELEFKLQDGNDRAVYNISIAVYGLDYLRAVCEHVFPEHYKGWAARFAELRQSLFDIDVSLRTAAPSEIMKMLRFMITMSHHSEDMDTVPRFGHEYAYIRGIDDFYDLDIDVDAFFVRYRAASSRRSMPMSFIEVESFRLALEASSMAKERSPADSPLISARSAHSRPRIIRLDGVKLDAMEMGLFSVVSEDAKTKSSKSS